MSKLLFLCFIFIFIPIINAQEKLKIAHMLYSSLDASPKDIKITLSLWMEEISETMDIELETYFYTSVQEIQKDMHSGKVNYMIIRSIDLVKHFNQDHLIEGFAPQRRQNNLQDRLLLVSSKENKTYKINDFKDKKFGICNSEYVGKIYIDTLLMQKNFAKHEDYFSKTVEYKKCSKVLLDLFFKKIDIAVIRQGTFNLVNELNPQVGRSIAVLESRVLGDGMVGFFSKNADKNLITNFYKGIDKVNNSVRSQQILTLFKADFIEKVDKESLKILEMFYLEYVKLGKGRVK